jgi:hypothetical protein
MAPFDSGRWASYRRLCDNVLISTLVDMEGVVEYKSLPSGLHNIKEDLV